MRAIKRQKKPRVYAFIDSQNLNVSTQKFGWKMDWRKFRKFLADKFNVTHAYLFIGYVPEQETMYEQLHDAGYNIILKPTYDMSRPRPEASNTSGSHLDGMRGDTEERRETYKAYDEQAPEVSTKQPAKSIASVSSSAAEQGDALRKPIKGNIDADLVLWVMKELKNYDKAIIVSGDGDFYSLVEYLVQQGKLLNLMTPSWQYSSLFKPFEKYIERLDRHRRELAYKDKKRFVPKNNP